MAQYCFGLMVKEYRNRLNISQEELCSGICDVSTLSKIETGKRLPHRTQATALMNKLGIPMEYHDIPLTLKEIKKTKIEIEIRSKIKKRDYDFFEMLEEYKSIDTDMDIIEKQFYLYVSTFLEIKHYSYEERKEIMIEAIKLTVPTFSLEYPIEKHLFTLQEIRIINDLSFLYSKLNRKDVSIMLLKKLEKNFEKNYCHNQDCLDFYLIIITNLAMLLGLVNNLEDCIFFSEKGIDFSKKFQIYGHLPTLIYIKGYSYILRNGQDYEPGIILLKKSFIMLKEFGMEKSYSTLKDTIINNFGLKFWKKM